MHLYLRRILIRDAATQSILCGIDLAVTQRDRDLTANEIGFILEVAAFLKTQVKTRYLFFNSLVGHAVFYAHNFIRASLVETTD